MPRRKPPGRSTRAANSAIHCRTHSGRRSTIRICLVACVIGDGEAETGPLATSWHGQQVPLSGSLLDGAVLPILHLNGYKIANPTVLAQIEPDELHSFLQGNGWAPIYVEGDDPPVMHHFMAAALDQAAGAIAAIQQRARAGGGATAGRPRWPLIVLRSPKGWTCPKVVDGLKLEGTWRAHQVPIADTSIGRRISRCWKQWMPLLPAGGIVRRGGSAERRHHQPGAGGNAPHGRQSAHQRRRGAPAADAGFHRALL